MKILFPLIVLLPLLVGCAPGVSVRELNGFILSGAFDTGTAKVTGARPTYGEKNELLYHLERGMFLHLAGHHGESNQTFEEAKRVIKKFYTKSVTAKASTFLINDNTTPYVGEDYERALIHVFSALNYVNLGLGEEALVECRQVDLFLKNLRFESADKNDYREDAFARYLAGLIYEEQGETNDAFISYVKALNAYDVYQKNYGTPPPTDLVGDALRTAKKLGLYDKIEDIQKRWGSPPMAPTASGGEIIVLHYAGLGPEKVDAFFEISLFNGWPYVNAVNTSSQDQADIERAGAVLRGVVADKMIRVAFPKIIRRPYQAKTLEVTADTTGAPNRAQLVQDVGAIAEKELANKNVRTRARAIARAVTKHLLAQEVSHAVEEKNDETAGFLVKALFQAAATATEVADKRCWHTLPDRISMARSVLPEGPHNLVIRLLTEDGTLVQERKMTEVPIRSGKKTFIIIRSAV